MELWCAFWVKWALTGTRGGFLIFAAGRIRLFFGHNWLGSLLCVRHNVKSRSLNYMKREQIDNKKQKYRKTYKTENQDNKIWSFFTLYLITLSFRTCFISHLHIRAKWRVECKSVIFYWQPINFKIHCTALTTVRMTLTELKTYPSKMRSDNHSSIRDHICFQRCWCNNHSISRTWERG